MPSICYVFHGLQKDTFQGHQKCDFAIIYYTLARSEVSQKDQFWVLFGTPFWHQITKTGVSERLQKKDPTSSHIWVLFWDPSERDFTSDSTPWHSQCRAWRVEPQKQSIWLPQGHKTMSKSIQKVYKTQDSVVFSCAFFLLASPKNCGCFFLGPFRERFCFR